MKTNLRIILLCALVLTACRNAGISLTVEQEESMFGKWIATLASDGFGGRKPMTPNEDVTTGVPAVVIEPGKDLVHPDHPNTYPFASWYHKPTGEYHPDWDVEGSLAHIHLMFGVALELANAQRAE